MEKAEISEGLPERSHASSSKIGVNVTETCVKADADLTQPCSRPVRYELVRHDGVISPMKFDTAEQAVKAAGYLWPDQEQEPDRTGKGWDVQVARGQPE